jgi:hypothetical protein
MAEGFLGAEASPVGGVLDTLGDGLDHRVMVVI